MASPSNMKAGKGWFVINDPVAGQRDGDRSLDQQMVGLDRLVAEVHGKTILDIGAAEGLISIALVRAGAASAVGLEIVPSHVEFAKQLSAGMPCEWIVANLNEFDCGKLPQADVVLMLACLHKLKDPSRVCAALAARAADLCVIRLPPTGPVIRDLRSGNVPHDIGKVMDAAGFKLESEDAVLVDKSIGAEWVGYFRRRKPLKDVPPAAETKPVSVETKPQEPETKEAEVATASADPGTQAAAAETLPAEPAAVNVVAGAPAAPVGDDVSSAPVDQDAPKVTDDAPETAPDPDVKPSRRRRGLGSMFGK